MMAMWIVALCLCIVVECTVAMMSSSDSRKMYVPIFSGEPKDFQVWWMRFTAFAALAGFAAAIKNTRDVDLPPTEDTVLTDSDDDKKMAKARSANSLAMANLTMAFTTEALMSLINNAQADPDWPGGLAYRVVIELFQKFRPKDVMSKVELRREMNKVSMKKADDPQVLFDQLNKLQTKYDNALTNEDLIAKVLDVAPVEYHSTLTSETRIQGGEPTLENLKDAMREQWRIRYPGGTSESGEVPEVSLFGADDSKMKCYRCGKIGHRASNCPNEKKGSGGGSNKNKKCHICGRKGHTAENCWSDPKNADKVPAWFKKKLEKKKSAESSDGGGDEAGYLELVLASVDSIDFDDGIEVGMETALEQAAMTFPQVAGLLADPYLWIWDTGA